MQHYFEQMSNFVNFADFDLWKGYKKEHRFHSALRSDSVNDELLDLCDQLICVVRINGQLDGGEKIQAEDTHDGFSVHDVATRGKVNLAVKSGNRVYKVADVSDGGQFDVCCFHSLIAPFSEMISSIIIQVYRLFVNRFFVDGCKIFVKCLTKENRCSIIEGG